MKEAIMRWHSYQSLVVRARRKRVGRARPLGVPNSFVCDYDHEHEQEQEAEAAEEEEL